MRREMRREMHLKVTYLSEETFKGFGQIISIPDDGSIRRGIPAQCVELIAKYMHGLVMARGLHIPPPMRNTHSMRQKENSTHEVP